MYDDNTLKDLLGENYNSFKAELSYSLAVESIRNYTRAVGSSEDLFPSQLMALTKYYYEQDKLNNMSSIKQGDRSITYSLGDIPYDIKMTLPKYIRMY